MQTSIVWDHNKRIVMKKLLSEEGYSPAEIGKIVGVSSASVYIELRRGLSPEEYENRRYVKYDPVEASYRECLLAVGESGIEAAYERLMELKKR